MVGPIQQVSLGPSLPSIVMTSWGGPVFYHLKRMGSTNIKIVDHLTDLENLQTAREDQFHISVHDPE